LLAIRSAAWGAPKGVSGLLSLSKFCRTTTFTPVLGKLAERARDYRGDFEQRYVAGPGPGYEYEAGIASGWENAVMMAQSLLLLRALNRRVEHENADSADQGEVLAHHVSLKTRM